MTFVRAEWLNGKHTVFGRVVDGMKVLDNLESVGTDSGKPKKPCVITDCGEIKSAPKPKKEEPKKTKLEIAEESAKRKQALK